MVKIPGQLDDWFKCFGQEKAFIKIVPFICHNNPTHLQN